MDIGRVQPAGTNFGNTGVDHATTQTGPGTDPADQRQLIQAVRAVNGAELFGRDSELTFIFDRQTHKALVRVIDKRTREVVMQIPPEHVIRMAEERGLASNSILA
jgi:uncharacterized FlaG/YvyC family protein